jgi:hypothetical protein
MIRQVYFAPLEAEKQGNSSIFPTLPSVHGQAMPYRRMKTAP